MFSKLQNTWSFGMARSSNRAAPWMLFYILLLSSVSVEVLAVTSSCKSIPGSESWPSLAEWAQLNETTGGQLLQPSPPGAVCHSSDPLYDATLCASVQEAWSNEFFHQQNPISAEWNNWTNDTCLPIDGLPCSSEGYPRYVINATTSKHVKAGVDFGNVVTSQCKRKLTFPS
jgi:hypothetical protein